MAGAVAVVALVAGAALLVALAADVLRFGSPARADDDVAPLGRGVLDADTLPAAGDRRVLGVEDDVGFRCACSSSGSASPVPLQVFTDVTRRARPSADRELIDDVRGTPSAAPCSRHARRRSSSRRPATRRPAQVFVRRAIEQFQRAAELDPSNADAVYDLELALKLLRETGRDEAGER